MCVVRVPFEKKLLKNTLTFLILACFACSGLHLGGGRGYNAADKHNNSGGQCGLAAAVDDGAWNQQGGKKGQVMVRFDLHGNCGNSRGWWQLRSEIKKGWQVLF